MRNGIFMYRRGKLVLSLFFHRLNCSFQIRRVSYAFFNASCPLLIIEGEAIPKRAFTSVLHAMYSLPRFSIQNAAVLNLSVLILRISSIARPLFLFGLFHAFACFAIVKVTSAPIANLVFQSFNLLSKPHHGAFVQMLAIPQGLFSRFLPSLPNNLRKYRRTIFPLRPL